MALLEELVLLEALLLVETLLLVEALALLEAFGLELFPLGAPLVLRSWLFSLGNISLENGPLKRLAA